jgi:pyridoxine 5-phosphate synthase
MTTALSINVNKFALLRNSRGQNTPDVASLASRCLDLGAAGITVHPRPDGRHVLWEDVAVLRALTDTRGCEFNIEGYPSADFVQRVCAARPTQVTLVPDPPEALTSSFGWDLWKHSDFLSDCVDLFKAAGIRTSLFVDPGFGNWSPLLTIGADRVELFTYDYAHQYASGREEAIAPYVEAAEVLLDMGIGVNAGHDLNLENLAYFVTTIPSILEVSIGHALVCDCLEYGFDETVRQYVAYAKGNR